MRLLVRAADALMRSQVNDFVFLQALRMGRAELLEGATHAAASVQTAMRASLAHEDDEPLNAMRDSGSMAPALHAALTDEVRRGRREGDWAIELMLAELEEQGKAVSHGAASLPLGPARTASHGPYGDLELCRRTSHTTRSRGCSGCPCGQSCCSDELVVPIENSRNVPSGCRTTPGAA